MQEKDVANLRAGFESFRFIPMPFVVSINNANPKLILYGNSIEFRGGFTTKEIDYSEIEEVRVYFWWTNTNNLIIYQKNKRTTLIANFEEKDQLKFFLRIFKSKGCKLSYKAEAFILSTT